MTQPPLPTMPEQPAEPVTMLAVGGPRHGEEITVPGGARSWVDIKSAETYYRNAFVWIAHSPVNPRSALLRKAYRAEALVHESIAGDMALANAWWQALGLRALFDRYGVEVPVAEVQAGAAASLNAQRNAEQN